MKIAGVLLIAVGALLLLGGFVSAMQPSAYPLARVVGSFALPVILLWSGALLYRKGRAK